MGGGRHASCASCAPYVATEPSFDKLYPIRPASARRTATPAVPVVAVGPVTGFPHRSEPPHSRDPTAATPALSARP